MTTIAVRVPESDAADLQTLLDSVDRDAELEVAHPFDGETVVQTILVLSPMTYPYFRTWVTTRVSQRKNFSVVHNGTELKGYTAAEAAGILTTVAQTLPDTGESDDTNSAGYGDDGTNQGIAN